jgi:predicted porin
MAQSSVTLYGTLDVGYGSFSQQLQGESGAVGAKLTQKGLMYNNFDSSRWGFNSTEDLGGGQKAGVTVESWIGGLPRANFGYGTNDNGLATGAASQQVFSNSGAGQSIDATRLGDRLLFANFVSGAHEVRLGQQSSFTRDIIVPFQADTSNNVGNLAANDGTLAARYVQASYLYTGNGYGLGAALSNNVRSQTDVNQVNTAKGFHLKATGSNGPLAGGVAYSNVLTDTGAGAANTLAVTGSTATAPTAQLNAPTVAGLITSTSAATTKVTAAVASYDLRVVQLFAEYGKVAVTDSVKAASTSQLGTRSTENVGVRYPYGATGSFAFAQYSTGKIGYNTSGTTRDGDWKGYTVGVKNYLSKRTYAYVNAGSSSYDYADTKTLKASQFGAGLVHNF